MGSRKKRSCTTRKRLEISTERSYPYLTPTEVTKIKEEAKEWAKEYMEGRRVIRTPFINEVVNARLAKANRIEERRAVEKRELALALLRRDKKPTGGQIGSDVAGVVSSFL